MTAPAPKVRMPRLHSGGKECNSGLNLATDLQEEEELGHSMMISYSLRFGETVGVRRSTNFEQVVSCWSKCHSCNLFREVPEDFCDVRNHVKRDVARGREINVHSKIIM